MLNLGSFKNNKLLLALEFCCLCLVLPSIIITFRLAPYMFVFLWSAALVCFAIHRVTHFQNWKTLWKWDAVTWTNLTPIILRWSVCAIAMVAFVYFYTPERLFYLPQHNLTFTLILCCLYPILSALPQEFIFCTYFFNRFKPFFQKTTIMIVASAVVFAFAHVLFINWVAPTFSFLGGLIFAHTYAQHRSLALVTIEHALYGNWLFVVGLGWYFYGGAVAQ